MKTITTHLRLSENNEAYTRVDSVKGRPIICCDYIKEYLGELPEDITLTISDEPFESTTEAKLNWEGDFRYINDIEINGLKLRTYIGLDYLLESDFRDCNTVYFNIKPTK